MVDLYKTLIGNQFEAALCTLSDCIQQCPSELWHEPLAELRFCQIAFHTQFFTDVYLGRNLEELRKQAFHAEHVATFADYEELADRRQQNTYEKDFIDDYLDHCRDKAVEVISAETEQSLAHHPGFEWLPFSRAEVHVYNIRHIHHHPAQLSLHLRQRAAISIPSYRSGWGQAWRNDN